MSPPDRVLAAASLTHNAVPLANGQPALAYSLCPTHVSGSGLGYTSHLGGPTTERLRWYKRSAGTSTPAVRLLSLRRRGVLANAWTCFLNVRGSQVGRTPCGLETRRSAPPPRRGRLAVICSTSCAHPPHHVLSASCSTLLPATSTHRSRPSLKYDDTGSPNTVRVSAGANLNRIDKQ